MSVGRPLYDTGADRALYVAPAVWEPLERAVQRRNTVLVSGSRGAGKTSLLRQLELELRTRGAPVAFVDATGLESAAELAARLRAAAGDDGPASGEGRAARSLLAEIERLGGAPETTLLVDASGAAEAVYGLFGRQRDALWRLPHHYVVAVDADERLVALKPPADAFFDTVLELEPLPAEAVVELLRRRGLPEELDGEAIGEIAAQSGGNPRAALRSANGALVTGEPPSAAASRRAELLSDARALGRPHGMLMSELLDLGQASPSDGPLQNRLGLSRARITTLLRQLLEAGLVTNGADRTDAPGRPRTMYRPSLEVGE